MSNVRYSLEFSSKRGIEAFILPFNHFTLNEPRAVMVCIDFFKLQTMTAVNQKFLRGGPGGAIFSKSAPPGRRRQKKTE